jgi:alkanesulfonate monooxygenase SsuD/methylene tetrahydromethanopterin reductase-like flavin-dependent oxidoreductase (luciferase family)
LEALVVAKQIGSSDLVNHVKIAIGIVRGNQELKKFGLFDDAGVPDRKLFQNLT